LEKERHFMMKKRRGKTNRRIGATETRTAAIVGDSGNGNPPSQNFTGLYKFPGKFAFLEKYNIPDYALLQEDDPFTGQFDEVEAENTCNSLGARHQDGDPATLKGKIVTCDVDGRQTPVLFMFD
jgi:hypothetical protein